MIGRETRQTIATTNKEAGDPTHNHGPLPLLSSTFLVPRSPLCFIFPPSTRTKHTKQHSQTNRPPSLSRLLISPCLTLNLNLSLSIPLPLLAFFLYTAHFLFFPLFLILLLVLFLILPFYKPTIFPPSFPYRGASSFPSASITGASISRATKAALTPETGIAFSLSCSFNCSTVSDHR